MDDEDEGLICPECEEWFLVYTNNGGLGLNYCPCCGAAWDGEGEEAE